MCPKFNSMPRIDPARRGLLDNTPLFCGLFNSREAVMRLFPAAMLLALTLALGACACSPGYVGPAGHPHPGGCWIW